MFRAEALALTRLRAANAIRVPAVIASGDKFLVLEAIALRQAGANWQELCGRQLAELHLHTRQAKFGFDCHNYIGSTPQNNEWTSNWIAFWRTHRLTVQLARAARQLAATDPLLVLGRRLSDRLEEILAGADEPGVLLHGDLWSGNAAADEHGKPTIFDPASYYGRREAELGMMQLFGGFDQPCFDAYAELWPLDEGSARRIAVYRLYHELNHLNLFGSSYYGSCLATLRALV